MKKTIVVVAVVTGYCFLLVFIALLTISRAPKFYSSNSEILMLGQYALIPGVAVIFSRLIYGRQGWVRRALVTFAVGVFGGPLLPFLIALMVAPLALLSEFSVPLGAALSLLILALVVWGLTWWIRRLRRQSAEKEANRWLAERRSGVTRNEFKRQRQIIGWSLWIPSATVLLLFLFLPELWGVASHLVHPNMREASEYRFAVPASWIVEHRESDYRDSIPPGESGISGMMGIGLGRSFSAYVRQDFLSYWSIRTEACSGDRFPEWDGPSHQVSKVLARRQIGTAAKQITCTESWRSYWRDPTLDDVDIQCSGPPRWHASLCCNRKQAAAFYKMLGTLDYSTNAPPCPVILHP